MMNDSMLNALGYTNDEVIGKNYLSNFIPEEDHTILSLVFNDLIKNHKNRVNENRILTKDGNRLLLKWHGIPILDEKGNFDFFIGAGIDITERKKAEQALQKSEEQFRTLMEQSPIAIQIMNPDGKIVQVNNAYEKLWGITLEDLNEYNILQDKQVREIGMMPYIEKAFEGETAILPEFEYNVRKTVQKGRKLWIRSYIYPVKDDNGEIQNVVMIHEDITERKRAEAELKKLNEELEQRVIERTAEIENKNSKLEEMNKVFVGREVRMAELKKQIAELEKNAGPDKKAGDRTS